MIIICYSSVEFCFRNPNYSMNIESQNKLRPRLIEIENLLTVSLFFSYKGF